MAKKKLRHREENRSVANQNEDRQDSKLLRLKERAAHEIAKLGRLDSTSRQSNTEAFALDPWQDAVFKALERGDSVVVDAPTTAGKTRAVEAYFAANLNDPSFRAAYTTPVKSLSNDKVRELRALFGRDAVGIATGDVKENLDAPIVVTTLESYRNSLLGVEPDLGRRLVVFDEYHFIQDEGRGSAWEEAIILAPITCQILLLSASVANASEFAAWLRTLPRGESRQVEFIETKVRPVPLIPLVFDRGAWLLGEDCTSEPVTDQRNLKPLRQEDLAERLKLLLELGLTPVIIYCGKRLQTETMAQALSRVIPPLPEEESAAIGRELASCQDEWNSLSFMPNNLRFMIQGYGIGFHHAGLPPPARLAVEVLLKKGLLRFAVGTMGLSVGINFSVKSALISDYQRPGVLGMTPYPSSEILQMLGRAGRRGKDRVGFSLWPNKESYFLLGETKRDNVYSSIRLDPSTYLGLTGKGLSERQITLFYSQSFKSFTDKNASRLISEKVERLKKHLISVGALNEDSTLTEFGSIARYFPQAGGLYMARLLAKEHFTEDRLGDFAELAGALGLARFKEPRVPASYALSVPHRDILDELTKLYPFDLFPEVWDISRSGGIDLKEFNPQGGYIVKSWMKASSWHEVAREVVTGEFREGDATSVILRTATYVMSLRQCGFAALTNSAEVLHNLLLRAPLDFTP